MDIENTLEPDYFKKKVENTSDSFSDFLIQVGKTYLGQPISEKEFKIIVDTIIETLDIDKADVVMDLGCGNGLMTKEVAKKSDYIFAFDLSEELLSVASKYHRQPNIEYIQKNILDIDYAQYNVTKLYMYGVIQNLEHKSIRELLEKISSNKDTFILYIADIPDQEKILDFYHTTERRDFLFRSLIENKKSHLGTWWYQEHLKHICDDLGLSIEIKNQNPLLHTAHYRFDVVISKN